MLLCAAWLGGCGRGSQPPPPPPPPVTVALPLREQVTPWDEYTGHLDSPETATIAARVSGLIVSAPFREGSVITAGTLLFKIDPRPFQADLDSRNAAVAKDKAQLAYAQAQLERYEKTLATGAVAQQDYDSAKATFQQAQAALELDQAAAEISQLNLQWTDVTAPIPGRIDRKLVTVGNLVNGGAGQATALTTITSVDPMYCNVDVPEEAFRRYQAMVPPEALQRDMRAARIPCDVGIGGTGSFDHHGILDFLGNQVDPTTGTVRVRGVIANADGRLVPGLYVRMRIPASAPHPALLVPDTAVGTNQNMRVLLIVGNDNVVEQQTVQLGRLFGNLREITEGLSGGEHIIISGEQRAPPGTRVSPTTQPLTPPGTPASAPEPATNPSAAGSTTTRS